MGPAIPFCVTVERSISQNGVGGKRVMHQLAAADQRQGFMFLGMSMVDAIL